MALARSSKATPKRQPSTNKQIYKKHTTRRLRSAWDKLQHAIGDGAKPLTAAQLAERERAEARLDKVLYGITPPTQKLVAPSHHFPPTSLPKRDFDIGSIFTALDNINARKRTAAASPPPPRPHPQTESPFFRLPLEVRSMIYALALTTPQPIVDPCELMEIWRDESALPRPACGVPGAALLRTCSQTYREAVLTLYRENAFVFTSAYALTSFRGLDYARRGDLLRTRMMRNVRLWFGDSELDGCGMPWERAAMQARAWGEQFFDLPLSEEARKEGFVAEAAYVLSGLGELALDFGGWRVMSCGRWRVEMPLKFVEVMAKAALRAREVKIDGLNGDEYWRQRVELAMGGVGDDLAC